MSALRRTSYGGDDALKDGLALGDLLGEAATPGSVSSTTRGPRKDSFVTSFSTAASSRLGFRADRRLGRFACHGRGKLALARPTEPRVVLRLVALGVALCALLVSLTA